MTHPMTTLFHALAGPLLALIVLLIPNMTAAQGMCPGEPLCREVAKFSATVTDFRVSRNLPLTLKSVSLPKVGALGGIDIKTCLACGGPVRIIACIEDPLVIQKILDHLKDKTETTTPPHCPRAGRQPSADSIEAPARAGLRPRRIPPHAGGHFRWEAAGWPLAVTPGSART